MAMKSLMKGVKKRLSTEQAWERETQQANNANATIAPASPSLTSSNPSVSSPGVSSAASLSSSSASSSSPQSLTLSSSSSSSSSSSPIDPSTLPRCRISRCVSRDVLIHNLPALRDAAPSQRKMVLIKKLKVCCYIFRFDDKEIDSPQDQRDKELKRSTLLEIVNYLTVFKPAFTEDELTEMFEMLASNLFRPLPTNTMEIQGTWNPEEDEPASEPTWPHLQVVYEFLLRLATATDTDAKLLDKFFSRKFVLLLLELFDSEDPRERDYLKTILHRIYGNFMALRPFIRRAINNVFYRFIYETDRHNGIAELLEILGSIINGFALPLKEQHKQFLQRVLLPLHKVTHVSVFHPQLSYCVTQFLEKDATLAPCVVTSVLKFWPLTSSKKELMFLNELEEILDRIQSHHLQEAAIPLFKQLAKSINSPHFQVSERAIYVLNNDVILRFITANRETLIPILAKALLQNTFNRPDLCMQFIHDDNDDEGEANGAPKSPHSNSRASKTAGENGVVTAFGRSTYGSWKKPSENPAFVDEEGRKWFERGNWNPTIVELTADIIKLFNEMDGALLSQCCRQFANIQVKNSDYQEIAQRNTRSKREGWAIIEKQKQAYDLQHTNHMEMSSSSSSSSSTS